MNTIVFISLPGMQYREVTVGLTSMVELVNRECGSQLWKGLLVDGTFYPLVLVKHIEGRPEHLATLDQALAQVAAAIVALQPKRTTASPATVVYDRSGWIKLAATCRATLRAFGGTATPEEVLHQITLQLAVPDRARFKVTVEQVRRSLRYVAAQRSPGSNSYCLP